MPLIGSASSPAPETVTHRQLMALQDQKKSRVLVTSGGWAPEPAINAALLLNVTEPI
jgi:hypothetical protein